MRTNQSHAISLAFVLLGASQAAYAVESDAWQFEATPYLFAAGLDGEVGIRGVNSDVDVSFSDIVDRLDAGFMGLFTANRGPWTYSLEAVYMKLEDEGAKRVTGPFGRVSVSGALKVTMKLSVFQAAAAYRIWEDTTTVDLLGGLRYNKLEADADVDVTTTPAIVFPGGAKSAGGSESWTDAIVGVRAVHPVSDKVALVGYADVGAGGSDLTYQFILGANWEFSEDFTAKFGYRQLYWDYKNDEKKWDMTASGPYLGLGIRF
jgi:hypothetical protein